MALTQSILVIDDDSYMGDFITSAAEAIGVNCFCTTDPAVFLKHLTFDITLILLDLVMPTTDGITLLRALGKKKCEVDIVLMSGASEQTIGIAEDIASRLGLSVIGHLKKPFRLQDLEAVFAKSDIRRIL